MFVCFFGAHISVIISRYHLAYIRHFAEKCLVSNREVCYIDCILNPQTRSCITTMQSILIHSCIQNTTKCSSHTPQLICRAIHKRTITIQFVQSSASFIVHIDRHVVHTALCCAWIKWFRNPSIWRRSIFSRAGRVQFGFCNVFFFL